MRTWCYLTGLRDVIDKLRPQLRTFRTEDGTELLDVEGGLFPHPDTPAPVRFLPEYDNATLSFADRNRIVPDASGPRSWWRGSVLVDGFVSGTWRFERDKRDVVLAVEPWRKLTRAERSEVTAEATALIEWAEHEAGSGIRSVRVG